MAYLDDKVEVSGVVIAAGGGVAAGDGLVVDVRSNGDVLANGQTNDIVRTRKSEAVPSGREQQ